MFPSFFISRKMNRRRSGVSPVISTTIILAITITLGLGLWSFANSGVSSATQTFSDSVTQYGKFTSDKFVIANMDFNNPSANRIAFWIFNSGKTQTTISSIALTCRSPCSPPVIQTGTLCQLDAANNCKLNPDGSFDMKVDSKQLAKFGLTLTTVENAMTYYLKLISDTGASQTFLKKSG
jgi:hypothetical protein